jgi:hypothetical protein
MSSETKSGASANNEKILYLPLVTKKTLTDEEDNLVKEIVIHSGYQFFHPDNIKLLSLELKGALNSAVVVGFQYLIAHEHEIALQLYEAKSFEHDTGYRSGATLLSSHLLKQVKRCVPAGIAPSILEGFISSLYTRQDVPHLFTNEYTDNTAVILLDNAFNYSGHIYVWPFIKHKSTLRAVGIRTSLVNFVCKTVPNVAEKLMYGVAIFALANKFTSIGIPSPPFPIMMKILEKMGFVLDKSSKVFYIAARKLATSLNLPTFTITSLLKLI